MTRVPPFPQHATPSGVFADGDEDGPPSRPEPRNWHESGYRIIGLGPQAETELLPGSGTGLVASPS